MSERTYEANKAILNAWKREKQLVQEGKGTRDWSHEHQQQILNNGKAYDNEGRAFHGHHMKSVEKFPQFQGYFENIQFLTKSEHQAAHEGDFRNFTNGYYDPSTGKTKMFPQDTFEPVTILKLSKPVAIVTQRSYEKDSNHKEKDKRDDREHTSIQEVHSDKKAKKMDKASGRINTAGKKKRTKNRVTTFYREHKKGLETIDKVAKKVVELTPAAEEIVKDLKELTGSKGRRPKTIKREGDASGNTGKSKVASGTKRKSPREHMVKPYGQHCGRNRVWREKKAFKRGGKNK